MAVSDWSETAASNNTLEGINIAEGCPAANVNNLFRAVAAAIKTFSLTVPDTSTLMPKSGGAFTGTITRSSAGGYWYHANSSQATGPVYTQPVSTALPTSPAEGTVVLQY
jgi:hypothetical protein